MRHIEELELGRTNVTPAQFLAYVRRQIKKHGLTCIDPVDIDLDYFKAGNDLNFHYYNDPVNHPAAKAETSVSKPYEMQTYVLNWDGTVYNFIMEFDFDDEKTGHGYFFFINTWDDEEEAKDAEPVAAPVVEEVKEEAKEEEKQYFAVAFLSGPVACANIARAASMEEVEKYYNKYEWSSIRAARPYEVEEARRKGMPVITI